MRHVTQYGSCFARFGKHSMLLFIHACMHVSFTRPPALGLDSTGRGVAPTALNVIDAQSLTRIENMQREHMRDTARAARPPAASSRTTLPTSPPPSNRFQAADAQTILNAASANG